MHPDNERPRLMDITLHYLFDPLCGWCYGATPAICGAKRWQVDASAAYADPRALISQLQRS